MKAYEVHVCNDAHDDDGSIFREFYVFADNFVDATMKAGEALDELVKALLAAGLKGECTETLEIETIALQAEVVGNVGVRKNYRTSAENDRHDFKEWAKRIATRIRKDVG